MSCYYHDAAAALAAWTDARRRRRRGALPASSTIRLSRSPRSTSASAGRTRPGTSTTSPSSRSRSSSSSASSRRRSGRTRDRRVFRQGDDAWLLRQALGQGPHPRLTSALPRRQDSVCRAPPVARRQRVPVLAVRRSRHPDGGRRRRVGDRDAAGSAAETHDRAAHSEIAFRTRSACCTPRSPRSSASR